MWQFHPNGQLKSTTTTLCLQRKWGGRICDGKKGLHVELRIVKLKEKERKNKHVKATWKQRGRRKQIFSTPIRTCLGYSGLNNVLVVHDKGYFHNESSSLLLPISQLLLLSVISYGMQYPFSQFRSATLEVLPPYFLPTPVYQL